MLRSSKVVSVSLSPADYARLEKLMKRTNKSRSELIREMLDRFEVEIEWEKIYSWGRQTAKRMEIKSEQDVLDILRD